MAFIRLTIQYSSTRNRPKNGLSSSISLLLWQLCILGREIKFQSPDGRYRIQRGRTENQPRKIELMFEGTSALKVPSVIT